MLAPIALYIVFQHSIIKKAIILKRKLLISKILRMSEKCLNVFLTDSSKVHTKPTLKKKVVDQMFISQVF